MNTKPNTTQPKRLGMLNSCTVSMWARANINANPAPARLYASHV